jgi:hypothetical protein
LLFDVFSINRMKLFLAIGEPQGMIFCAYEHALLVYSDEGARGILGADDASFLIYLELVSGGIQIGSDREIVAFVPGYELQNGVSSVAFKHRELLQMAMRSRAPAGSALQIVFPKRH